MTKRKLYSSRAWLQAELASGKSPEKIAEEQGCTAQTIYNWARKHGLM